MNNLKIYNCLNKGCSNILFIDLNLFYTVIYGTYSKAGLEQIFMNNYNFWMGKP